MPLDATSPRNCLGGRNNAARNEAASAFVLACEYENRVACSDMLTAVHRLLPVERERLSARIANVGFDRKRHACSIILSRGRLGLLAPVENPAANFGTNYAAGSVTIFPKGSSKGAVYSNPSDCHYIWNAGYDDKGNLIMVAENDQVSETVTYCAVLKGSKSLTTLTASGFSIYSPDSTMWDGKYIAVGDQQLGGGLQSGFVETTLAGSTLTSHGQVVLSDTCDQNYTHVVDPFILGRKNTPVNDTPAVAVVGSNELCNAGFRMWHYPAGTPFSTFTFESAGESVSIKIL